MLNILKKIYSLLSKEQQKQIPAAFIMMILGALLETLSISMFVPMVGIITDSKALTENKLFEDMMLFFHWENLHTFETLLFFLIATLFILKNIFLYFQISYQAGFANRVRQSIQNKLYENCIYMPYEFYLNTNTGDILRNIYVDSMGVYNTLLSLMNILMEGVISLALVITVLVISPFISIVSIIIIGVIVSIIYFVVKPVMQSTGKTYSNLSGVINQWILQSTDNIKEIKVMRREHFFVDEFRKYSETYNDASCRNQVISNVPRLLIEAGTISGIIVLLGISYANGNDLSNTIQQLSAFALAAVRLLPSVNRLNTALNTVLFNETAVNHVMEALANSAQQDDNPNENDSAELVCLNHEINIKNASYRYPDAEKDTFDDISLKIKKGQIIGLIGESGAGKTTFVNLVLGLLNSAKGDIIWDNIKVNDRNKTYQLNIGYIPQQISLLDDTIKENIIFGAKEINEKRVFEVIAQAQLNDFVDTLPNGIQTCVGDRGVRLSGGQRQRIGIARALYMNPDFLVLDEATSALDTQTEKELMHSINSLKRHKTMIIIAHRISTLDACDAIYKMENGKLHLQSKIKKI